MKMIEKISLLMKEKGLNKRQLAIKCDLSYGAVDGFFKVSYENMKLTTFMKLCDFFNVTMDSMAYDDKEIEYRVDEKSDFNKMLARAYFEHPGQQSSVLKLLDLEDAEAERGKKEGAIENSKLSSSPKSADTSERSA